MYKTMWAVTPGEKAASGTLILILTGSLSLQFVLFEEALSEARPWRHDEFMEWIFSNLSTAFTN
jgi:hypothetical protein